MHKVAILAAEPGALFELGCAVELFALPRPELDPWYQTQVVSFHSEPLTYTGGVAVSAIPITSLAGYHTLVIPSWSVQAPNNPQLIAQLRRFAEAGGRLLSFCSGAFLLAQTGLLDGRPATTHWRYAEAFQARFPKVHFQPNVLYTYADNLGCSAGSAAALDLGLAVIRNDFGHKVANQVAKRLVVSPHRRGGQSQFVEAPLPKFDTKFADTLDWAIGHLHEPISVDNLAGRAAMSRRSFDRKFKQAYNQSANQWLVQQRVHRAQQLLTESGLSLEQVATESGFGSALNMRHHFKQSLGINPSQYRQQFTPA
ncbi:helix-turn-helix domain-containing protein [Halioxenophilus sp. WMMB6]|uniref:helix-turn-helix domain-containing protein n=1 Tax=Halioxenophilus sp. WMMB6 TaxID=3073815 RepID=UPI00295F5420|nr:helix-turn-helix domain-containing protein [Halioxenophilus sp. WMMB6]